MTAKQIYDDLLPHRQQFLDRAKRSAMLTIPYFEYLCDSNIDSHYGHTPEMTVPWNSLGTRGTHRLATKLLLALLPPNEPFFKLAIDEVEYAIATQGMDPERARKDKVQFETALSVLERAQLNTIASSNDRVQLYEMLQHLLIVGNVLGYIGEDSLSVYHLRNYVIQRDADGLPFRAVICESKVPSLLPEAAKKIWDARHGDEAATSYLHEPRAHIYTIITWDADRSCKHHQELFDVEIPGTSGKASALECPWLPLRMYSIASWDYSPGYIEAVTLGDLHTIDKLTQAVTEGGQGAARLVWGVKSSCPTSANAFAQAANGAVLPVGGENDIISIQAKIGNELAVTSQVLASIEQRCSTAFSLLNVRQSERTTQEEVIRTAQETDEMFASLYMILTVEFSYPYVRAKFARMQSRMPQVFDVLGSGIVQPIVSVGLSAVGRGKDLERFATFIRVARDIFGPELAANYTNPSRLFNQLAVASNLPSLDGIKTEDQVDADRASAEEARQQEMQMRLAEAASRSSLVDPAKQAMAEKAMAEMGQPPPGGGPATPPMPQ